MGFGVSMSLARLRKQSVSSSDFSTLHGMDAYLAIRIDSSLSSNSLKIRFQPKQFTVTEADEDSADSSSSSDDF